MPQVYDQQRVKSLLDFIAKREVGTTGASGYNRVYGRNKSWNLSSMTLDDVMRKQAAYVRGGSKSSAAGRYQFLRGTLASLKKSQGLSGRERFTPQLQDRLGLALLRRRGFESYQAGRMSGTTFANNVAKEWASMPVVSGRKRGRSYYSGDGLNNSLVNVNPFKAAIRGSLTAGRGDTIGNTAYNARGGGSYDNQPFQYAQGNNRISPAQMFNLDASGAPLPGTNFIYGNNPGLSGLGGNDYQVGTDGTRYGLQENYAQSSLGYLADTAPLQNNVSTNAPMQSGMDMMNLPSMGDAQRVRVSSAISPV